MLYGMTSNLRVGGSNPSGRTIHFQLVTSFFPFRDEAVGALVYTLSTCTAFEFDATKKSSGNALTDKIPLTYSLLRWNPIIIVSS